MKLNVLFSIVVLGAVESCTSFTACENYGENVLTQEEIAKREKWVIKQFSDPYNSVHKNVPANSELEVYVANLENPGLVRVTYGIKTYVPGKKSLLIVYSKGKLEEVTEWKNKLHRSLFSLWFNDPRPSDGYGGFGEFHIIQG